MLNTRYRSQKCVKRFVKRRSIRITSSALPKINLLQSILTNRRTSFESEHGKIIDHSNRLWLAYDSLTCFECPEQAKRGEGHVMQKSFRHTNSGRLHSDSLP